MSGVKFTKGEEDLIKLMYADYPTSVIAKELNRTVYSIRRKAQILKLSKSTEFMENINKKELVLNPNIIFVTETIYIIPSKLNFT